MKKLILTALLGIFSLSAQELLMNPDFSVVENVKDRFAKTAYKFNGEQFPARWTLSDSKDQNIEVNFTRNPNTIHIKSPNSKILLYARFYRIARKRFDGHELEITVKCSGKGEIGFGLFCYNYKGAFINNLSYKTTAKVNGSNQVIRIRSGALNLATNAMNFAPFVSIRGDVKITGVSLKPVKPELPKPDTAYKKLTPEKKLSRINASSDWHFLCMALCDRDRDIRNRACEKISQLNENAAPAIDRLVSILENDSYEPVRVHAAEALGRIGKAAYPAVRELLLGGSGRTQLTLATALRGLPNGVPAELKEAVEWANPPVARFNTSQLPDGSFEASEGKELVGWEIQFVNGARGSYEVDPNVSRHGIHSLKITKTNGKGYILLKSKMPVYIPGNSKPLDVSSKNAAGVYNYRFYFRSIDASPNTLLLPRFIDEKGNLFGDDNGINRGHGIVSQSYLRNTPAHSWSRRIIMYKPRPNPAELRPAIVLYGNPATVWIDDIQFPAEQFKVHESGPTHPAPRYTLAEALKIVEKRSPVSAKVVKEKNGKVSFYVNGEKCAPVLHQVTGTRSGDYDFFHRLGGVKLQVAYVRLGGNSRYAPFLPSWNGDPKNYKPYLDELDEAIRRCPEGNFILGFGVTFPIDFVDKNPEEAWLNEKGERAYGTAGHMRGFAKTLPEGFYWWPSQYSEKAWHATGEFMRNVLRDLKKKPYAKLFAGAFISGMHDGQFQISYPDYSAPAVKAWREFLRRQYKTDAALAQAWNDPNAKIATAAVPPAIPAGIKNEILLHPEKYRRFADYREFREARIWKNSEYFARIFKEEFGQDKITLTWCMGGGWQKNFDTMLNSCYDAIVPQPSYERRIGGRSGGVNMAAETYLRHGKLVIAELDTRNWMRCIYNEVNDMWIGVPRTHIEFRNQLMKDAGAQIAHYHGYWHFDIGSNEFRHPKAQEIIRKLRETADTVFKKASLDNFTPGAAFIFHQRSVFQDVKSGSNAGSIASALINTMLYHLRTSGVPMAYYFLEDMMKTDAYKKHKVFIIANANMLNAAERSFIEQKLKTNGNTIIWIHTPGILNETRFAPENVGKLIGMDVKYDPIPRNYEVTAVRSNDPLAKNLQLNLGVADVNYRVKTLSNSKISKYFSPMFRITDKNAVALGKFNDGSTALAVKRHPEYTSVFCAAPGGLDPELLSNIAEQANIYKVTRPGLLIEVNDFFMSIHGMSNGKFELALPRKVKIVRDAYSGKIIAENTDRITLNIRAWESRWLIFE